jgi:hypothetical protein
MLGLFESVFFDFDLNSATLEYNSETRLFGEETNVFNRDLLMTEFRPNAIGFYLDKESLYPSYMVSYSDIHKILSEIKIDIIDFKNVKNLKDYLLFHCYRGEIKQSSVNYKPLIDNEFKKKLDLYSEIEVLVREHSIWGLYN